MTSQVIECRSLTQAYEDNLVELHNRLTKWSKQLYNERCFGPQEYTWKQCQLKKLDALIVKTESAILDGDHIDIYITEMLGIKYSSMMRY